MDYIKVEGHHGFVRDKIGAILNINKEEIKAAQKNAFLKTLKTKGIQFREFKIKSITEEVLGELFSYFILETVAVGKMSNTDPFNQPAVEQVKHNTKKLLL